jgi:gluconokinase
MTNDRLILSLDLGTSSFRAMLFRASGRAVRGSRVSVVVGESAPGVLDPLQATEAVERLIDAACLNDAVIGATVEVVVLSCFWHSLLGVDWSGKPITPLYLWSDLRSAEDAAALRQELDERAVQARTGAALHPTFWPAKIRWIARTSPTVHHEVASWLSFGDYLLLRWFGRAQSSLSMASATGLMDQSRLTWDEAMVGAARVKTGTLPEIVAQPFSGIDIRDGYRGRWPALGRARWLPAVGDGACSNLGVGAIGHGRWAITVGTSAAVRAVLPDDLTSPPPGLWRYRLDRKRPVLGGALNNGGNVYAWLLHTLRTQSSVELERALLERPWGSHGLRVDPSLSGERSPHWPLHATASIEGLTIQTSALDITQAVLESVAERIAEITRLMEAALGPPNLIVATGGAMVRSTAWRKMLEYALNREVSPSPVQESSLRGAALLAIEQMQA